MILLASWVMWNNMANQMDRPMQQIKGFLKLITLAKITNN